MNGLKSMSKRVVACLLTILLLAAPLTEPLFLEETKAAEIGMVGALSGSTTLWEIFGTLFAGAGIIVANDNIQSVASNNLGSSSYSLEEMERLGFIRVPEGGSNALDWDWSGLEDELENSTAEDTKIIKGVFSQNGGTGQGGGDEDPWYKKAVNWVKAAVQNGSYAVSQNIRGNAGQVELTLAALSSMVGAAFKNNVEFSQPVDSPMLNLATTTKGYAYFLSSANNQRYSEVIIDVNTSQEYKIFYSYRRMSSGTYLQQRITAAIKNAQSTDYITVNIYTYDTVTGETEHPVNSTYTYADNLQYGGIVGGVPITSSYVNAYYANPSSKGFKNLVDLGPTTSSGNNTNTSAIAWIRGNEDPVSTNNAQSPDLYTQNGNATVPNGQPAWVPTPYVQPGTKIEILPQPKIDEFTQYVVEEMPDPAAASEAWIDTVNPYIQTEPTPAPTTRPQPTQKPNVTTIPAGDPGGEDNPINVTEPDPMPIIEGGFATTYGLMDYFPFCIPSDIVAIYKIFEVDGDARAAPYIDWNLKIDRFGVDEHIVLDFSIFDSSAAVCRILMFITFCFGLLIATKNLIWS